MKLLRQEGVLDRLELSAKPREMQRTAGET
jgi:hypothetical protein